ncbi:hypothetical protein D3P07_02680 [Paenibacillus sp. 1011MAR3C5]|uniref:hypothetical protein n=1 Tax=Paenibacillus sp. 1011MAR3C5 TaxID=1675787 RepID=UPI000E6D0E84|nr:hypothetical protein [Paenibacillus sp. 1011MAR3C5]RJE90997.1 hypothetical protein D3P07_02680 [Paenibacillus sp. 1011MAR3C5]
MKKWILLLTIFAAIAVLPACDSAPAEPYRRIVQSEYTGLIAKVDKAELIQLADVILRGVVTGHRSEYDSDSMPVTDTDIEVLEVFKGKPEDRVAVRTKGRDPYREAHFDGRLSGYLPGDEVILFLAHRTANPPDKDDLGYYVVGVDQGAFLIETHNSKKVMNNTANNEYGFIYDDFNLQLHETMGETQPEKTLTTILIIKIDKHELERTANVILRGEVLSQTPDHDGFVNPITDTVVGVLDVYRGKPKEEIVVRTPGLSQYTRAKLREEGLGAYEVGDEVILFLTDQKGERPDKDEFDYFVIGMGQGAFLLETYKGKKQMVSQANEEYGFTFKSFKKQLKQLAKENKQNPVTD